MATSIRKTVFVEPDQILRLPEVKSKTGLGHSAIYERMNKGLFPRSIDLGGKAVGWSSNELDVWIESRKALRDRAA